MTATTATCWADPLTRAERAELARMLARHCKRSWDAAGPDRCGPFSNAEITRCHALIMVSVEMSDLHLDVTERAEVPAS